LWTRDISPIRERDHASTARCRPRSSSWLVAGQAVRGVGRDQAAGRYLAAARRAPHRPRPLAAATQHHRDTPRRDLAGRGLAAAAPTRRLAMGPSLGLLLVLQQPIIPGRHTATPLRCLAATTDIP